MLLAPQSPSVAMMDTLHLDPQQGLVVDQGTGMEQLKAVTVVIKFYIQNSMCLSMYPSSFLYANWRMVYNFIP